MNKWKIAFFSTLALLVLSNAFWMHFAVDAGFTQTYLQDGMDKKSRAFKTLSKLVVDSGHQYSKQDYLRRLRQLNGDAFIVEEKHLIDVDGLKFHFVNGKLSEVKD